MMKTILILFVLFFSSSVVAEDASDFQIEGFSLGESLLNYMSKEKIKTEIKENKYMYTYLTDNFGEVYLYNRFENYDYLGFIVKTVNANYIIHQIRGIKNYSDDEECYEKQISLILEVSLENQNVKRVDEILIYPPSIDPSGKSTMRSNEFIFNSGGSIVIACVVFEESVRKLNNWTNGLSVVIADIEANNWFRNHIN